MGELSKPPFFQLSRATWEASRNEDRPILLIFKEELCPFCEKFEQDVLSYPSVQSIINTHYTPVIIDIHRFPELYERFADIQSWVHPIHCASHGEIVGNCANDSPKAFIRTLERLKRRLSQEDNGRLELNDLTSFYKPQVNPPELDSEIIDLIAETTLSFLLNRYDKEDGGWEEQGGIKHHFSAAVEFLLLLYNRSRDKTLLNLVQEIYDKTMQGLYDPLQDGFYLAASSKWQPLLKQKTLGNNIAISRTIFHTYQMTGELEKLRIVINTLAFLVQSLWDKSVGMFRYGAIKTKRHTFFDPKSNCEATCLILDTNEIMIRKFQEPSYLPIAKRILQVLSSHKTKYGIPHDILNPQENQFLLRDQAAYLKFLLHMYSNTGDYLDKAIQMANVIGTHYYDPTNFLFNDRVSFPKIDIIPLKNALYRLQDNTTMVKNFIVLTHLTGDPKWLDMATRCVASYSSSLGVSRDVPFPPEFAISLQHLTESPIEIIILGKPTSKAVQGLLEEAKKIYEPFKIIQILDPQTDARLVQKRIPRAQLFPRPMVYIKVDNVLSPPAFTPQAIQNMLTTLLQAIEMNA